MSFVLFVLCLVSFCFLLLFLPRSFFFYLVFVVWVVYTRCWVSGPRCGRFEGCLMGWVGVLVLLGVRVGGVVVDGGEGCCLGGKLFFVVAFCRSSFLFVICLFLRFS